MALAMCIHGKVFELDFGAFQHENALNLGGIRSHDMIIYLSVDAIAAQYVHPNNLIFTIV